MISVPEIKKCIHCGSERMTTSDRCPMCFEKYGSAVPTSSEKRVLHDKIAKLMLFVIAASESAWGTWKIAVAVYWGIVNIAVGIGILFAISRAKRDVGPTIILFMVMPGLILFHTAHIAGLAVAAALIPWIGQVVEFSIAAFGLFLIAGALRLRRY